jgi:hypothetical protein
VLQNQLNALNLKPLEYIPLYKIRQRLLTLTEAMNRGEIFDESEFDYLLRCMDVNEEYIEEQKEKERKWRDQISTYAKECLIEQRRYIPSDIFVSTHTQLVHDKGIPAILAKRFMQKKCLWLIRMSESYISKLHYAELQGKYSVEGNNLDIVETLAVYASVPVKFANDGNGKKALWRKSLEDTVKKLMSSKENNTLSASQLRNPAYKNHNGLFTSNELYNPDTMITINEEDIVSLSKSKHDVKSLPSSSISVTGSCEDAIINPMCNIVEVHDNNSILSKKSSTTMQGNVNIKSELERMFSNSNVDKK